MTTLATILDNVLDETGFDKPSSYFGNSEEAAVRARRLANASIAEMLRIDHRELVKEGTISMTTATKYDLPDDLHRFMPNTMYESGQADPVNFPATDMRFAVINSSGIGDGVWTNVRIVDGQFEVDEPEDGETLEYTYLRNTPVQATGGGSLKAAYTADTDEWLLDDRLHELDIIWRWKKLHGMDYQDDFGLYRQYKNSFMARDGGNRVVNINNSGTGVGGPMTDMWVN